MEEIWKDIPEYEGLYQVSNFGRVKSLSVIRFIRGKYILIKRDKILKQIYNPNGYLYVGLHNNNKSKQYLIHRLVAEAFIDNPLSKPFVNHIDFNRLNNKIDNLEWCTQKENVYHSINNMRCRHNAKNSNTGEQYIYYRKSNNTYRVIIDKKEYYCKTLEEAIKKRDEVLNEKI